jgi:hypothetical protein
MPVARIGRNDEDPRVHGVVDSCRVTTEREQPNRQNELPGPEPSRPIVATGARSADSTWMLRSSASSTMMRPSDSS